MSKLEILVTKTIDHDLTKMHYASNANHWTHQPSSQESLKVTRTRTQSC
jgi:hypothetical protein